MDVIESSFTILGLTHLLNVSSSFTRGLTKLNDKLLLVIENAISQVLHIYIYMKNIK
jgi:hypothetical protein